MANNGSTVKISVVIPVYNGEKYISHLIDSLKAQTFTDLEFIFVDDLGEDNSMSFVHEWASTDSRVRILRNEKNLGEGGSRNRGIEAARGIYINTIDPDDWVAEDFYELLYAKAVETSADIVKGTRVVIDEDTGNAVKREHDINKAVTTSLAKGAPLYLRLHYEHQTLIFKRALLDEDTKYGRSGNAADTTFLLKLCSKTSSFALEKKARYYYLKRRGSATGEHSLKRSLNELISLEEQIDFTIHRGAFDRFTYQYLAGRYNTYASRFVHACEESDISTQDKEQFISDLKSQFLRLPDHTRLYKFNPKIFALIKLDMVLANRLYNDISVCSFQVADWIRYILALDGDRRGSAKTTLEHMLVEYMKGRKKEGASLFTMTSDIVKMAGKLRDAKQKKLFCGIVKNAFTDNFPSHRKALIDLLFRPGKQRAQ